MKGILSSRDFIFICYRYEHEHYTDSRGGCSLHYIGMLEQGSCRIVTEDQTLEAGPGQPFYIPQGLRYQSYWSGDAIVLRSLGFRYFPDGDAYALQLLDEQWADKVRAVPLQGRPDSAALGQLYTLLGQMVPELRAGQHQPGQHLVRQATACIRADPESRITEVARQCGVSESALYAAFKRQGTTPNRVRQQILVSLAVQLLTTTDSPVQEISDRLGFSSPSYFRKVLYACTGQTPRQLRKNAAKV